LVGIGTTKLSAHHPEGSDQVERFNWTVEAILVMTKVIETYSCPLHTELPLMNPLTSHHTIFILAVSHNYLLT